MGWTLNAAVEQALEKLLLQRRRIGPEFCPSLDSSSFTKLHDNMAGPKNINNRISFSISFAN
jgi:hypothetical protein